MITLKIDIDASAPKAALDRLEAALMDLRIPMEEARDMIPGLIAERFMGFQKHAGTYEEDYLVRKRGLPVGVLSGKLFGSIKDGTAFESELEPFFGALNAKLTMGIDLSKFRNEYPKYFDKWLRDRGDDLMSLTPDQAVRVIDVFQKEVMALAAGAIG